jgi:hypothetical protein
MAAPRLAGPRRIAVELWRGRAGLECEFGSGTGGGGEEGPDRRAPPVSAREGRKEGARGRLLARGAQLGR